MALSVVQQSPPSFPAGADVITETFHVVGTTSDVLVAPSRLAALPYDGTVIIEMQASANDSSNLITAVLQLPDGSTPLDGVRLPAGVTAGALNADDKYVVSVQAAQGGHILLQLTETGTTTAFVRVTLMP